MNYSTIKKVVAYSMLSVLSFSIAKAQTTAGTKVFGGAGQYRTWSFGINGGVIAPTVVIGGSNDAKRNDLSLGYGISLRKQVNHQFGFIADLSRGEVEGHNSAKDLAGFGTFTAGGVKNTNYGMSRFKTDIHYAASLSAILTLTSVDFLHRENGLNFFLKGGVGTTSYAPFKTAVLQPTGEPIDGSTFKNAEKAANKPNYHSLYIPAGVGIAYKITDKIGLDLGYTMNFVDDDNLDDHYAKGSSKDKWSYGYVGLDFSLGDASKPNIDWINPVALMYDELKDPTLRQELEALKGRVSTLENTVNQLSADADGDGVSNKFDKCPNTPAGSVVDGAGCPIKFPTPPAPVLPNNQVGYYDNIMFEFDSSVLKTASYPTLDKLATDLKASPGVSIWLNGYASAEGTEAYNLRLSEDRANSVKTYLVNSGVDASKVITKGFGEANPVASNATEEGRIQNRRVEIKK